MSHQESGLKVVVTVVAGGGEDVGHPAGGCLWQDSGHESEEAMRAKPSRWDVVPRRRNWASATLNQAVGLAVQKSGSLKKRGGDCPAGWLPAAALFSSTSMSLMRKEIRE